MTAGAAAGIAAVLALALPAGPARDAVDGYVVTQRVTTNAGTPSGTVRIKIASGRVRLEFEGVQQQGVPEGVYFILRDDGRTMIVVPGQKSVMLMDANALANGIQSALGNFGAMQLSNVSATVDQLGAGERIAGYATRKYRVTQRYTATLTMMGRVQRTTYESTSELWTAGEIPALDAGFDRFTRSFGGLVSGGAHGTAKEVTDAMRGKAPTGFPVRSVITSVVTPAGRAPVRTLTTVEVSEITRGSIPATDFEVPTGYQITDMTQLMGSLRKMTDTSRRRHVPAPQRH